MTTFTLTPWRLDHAPSVARYASNEKIACNLRDGFPYPYTLEDAAGYIQSCMEQTPDQALLYAIEVEGEAVGSIGAFFQDNVYRKSAEIGYWLGEPFWRQGIMSRAVTQLCREIFDSRPDIVRLYAEPFAPNTGSRRALEKAGFVLEGIKRSAVVKGGVVMDSCLYALVRD